MILIVEDDAQLLKLMRVFFEEGGLTALCATTAEEGIELAQQHRPEIVICDLYLPGISGLMLAAALKADQALRGPFLIAITGAVQGEGMPEEAVRAGFDLFIEKPFSVSEMIRTVQRIEHKVGLLEEVGW